MTNSNMQDIVLPKFRNDLIYKEIEEDGEKFVVAYDQNMSVEQPIRLPGKLFHFLQELNGKIGLSEFSKLLIDEFGDQTTIQSVLQLINELEFLGYFETETHDLLKKNLRPMVCAGNSYSKDPEELQEYLDALLRTVDKDKIKPGADTVIVPHIDYQIGEGSHKAYASAYHALRDTEADLFVIFGTSHYGNSGRFMMSQRDFLTPLGMVKNDIDLLDQLQVKLPYDLPVDEVTHRLEHSIELQVVLLRHVFADRDFSVFPVLIGSFHDFVLSRSLPGTDNDIRSFLDSLNDVIEESGKKAAYIASVDFAHVGRRFDDDFDAESILDELREEDKALIDHLNRGDSDGFFSTVSQNGDRRKICGLSPIYSLLQMRKKKQGELLHYHQWNDSPTGSAVTFASIAYYD